MGPRSARRAGRRVTCVSFRPVASRQSSWHTQGGSSRSSAREGTLQPTRAGGRTRGPAASRLAAHVPALSPGGRGGHTLAQLTDIACAKAARAGEGGGGQEREGAAWECCIPRLPLGALPSHLLISSMSIQMPSHGTSSWCAASCRWKNSAPCSLIKSGKWHGPGHTCARVGGQQDQGKGATGFKRARPCQQQQRAVVARSPSPSRARRCSRLA